jgi:hypothetical protein
MEKLGHEENKVVKRGSAATGKRKHDDSAGGAGGREEVVALKKRITRLEAENRQLRNQIGVLTDSMNRSPQSLSDSVREQQHNFFKYSNVRR